METEKGYFSLLWDSKESFEEWNRELSNREEGYIEDLNLKLLYREICRLGKFSDRYDFEKIFLHPCTRLSTILYRQSIMKRCFEDTDVFGIMKEIVDCITESQKKLGHIRSTRDEIGQKVFYLQMLYEFLDGMETAYEKLLSHLTRESQITKGIVALADDIVGEEGKRKKERLSLFLAKLDDTMPHHFILNKDEEQVCQNIVIAPEDRKEDDFAEKLKAAALFFLEDYDFSINIYQNDLTVLDQRIREYSVRQCPELLDEIREMFREYEKFSFWSYIQLSNELVFYLACVQFRKEYEKAGFYFTMPVLAKEAGETSVNAAYDMTLAINMYLQKSGFRAIVNDYTFQKEEGRLFILTGANQGGKTTFIRGIGTIQCMAQIGMFVPARKAVLSIVNQIHTLFSRADEEASMVGRFEQELQSMHGILRTLHDGDMVLFNEPFTSTQRVVAVTLLKQLLPEFDRRHCIGGLVTHFHEIFDELAGDHFYSLVAGVAATVEQRQRTYQILRQDSYHQSYARDIVEKCGATYEQLCSVIGADGQHHTDNVEE